MQHPVMTVQPAIRLAYPFQHARGDGVDRLRAWGGSDRLWRGVAGIVGHHGSPAPPVRRGPVKKDAAERPCGSAVFKRRAVLSLLGATAGAMDVVGQLCC